VNALHSMIIYYEYLQKTRDKPCAAYARLSIKEIYAEETGISSMRRLVIEFQSKDLQKFSDAAPLMKVKSLEILHFISQDERELSGICKIVLKRPHSSIEDFTGKDKTIEMQVLEREKEGAYIVFFRAKQSQTESSPFDMSKIGGCVVVPFEIKDGKLKITFLGNSIQVNRLLHQAEIMEVRHKVVSLTDAKYSQESPLSRLTEKQRRILIAAYRQGYYDLPRKINSEQLAKRLDVVSSTLVEHLRKAELRILTGMLGS
jgi:predicted DNA binding protein